MLADKSPRRVPGASPGMVARPRSCSVVAGANGRPSALHRYAGYYGIRLLLSRARPNKCAITRAHAERPNKCAIRRAALDQIQLTLGHSSIQTTERYLGVEQNLESAPCDVLGLSLYR